MIHVEFVLTVFMIIGVIASAAAGALRAIETKMDITGAILLAFFAANAGGTVRDLLLGVQVFWMKDHDYVWLSSSVGAAIFLLYRLKRSLVNHKQLLKAVLFADALGLAAFSIAGVERALEAGQTTSIAVLMGIWTAVGGGIVADVISNRPPAVFSSEFYITVSFVGSLAYVLFHNWVSDPAAAMLALIIMVLFRVASIKLKLDFSFFSNK